MGNLRSVAKAIEHVAPESRVEVTSDAEVVRHDGDDSTDLVPVADPPVRKVKQIDKQFIGAAPGLDGADSSVKLQLPILGDAR